MTWCWEKTTRNNNQNFNGKLIFFSWGFLLHINVGRSPIPTLLSLFQLLAKSHPLMKKKKMKNKTNPRAFVTAPVSFQMIQAQGFLYTITSWEMKMKSKACTAIIKHKLVPLPTNQAFWTESKYLKVGYFTRNNTVFSSLKMVKSSNTKRTCLLALSQKESIQVIVTSDQSKQKGMKK